MDSALFELSLTCLQLFFFYFILLHLDVAVSSLSAKLVGFIFAHLCMLWPQFYRDCSYSMQNKLFLINTVMQCRSGQVGHNIYGEVDRMQNRRAQAWDGKGGGTGFHR